MTTPEQLEAEYHKAVPYGGFYSPLWDAVEVVLRFDDFATTRGLTFRYFPDAGSDPRDPLRRAAFWAEITRIAGSRP